MGNVTTVRDQDLAGQFRNSGKRARRATFLLVLPLLAFLTITFFLPIFNMLNRSVEDTTIADNLPRAAVALRVGEARATGLTEEQALELITFLVSAAGRTGAILPSGFWRSRPPTFLSEMP